MVEGIEVPAAAEMIPEAGAMVEGAEVPEDTDIDSAAKYPDTDAAPRIRYKFTDRLKEVAVLIDEILKKSLLASGAKPQKLSVSCR